MIRLGRVLLPVIVFAVSALWLGCESASRQTRPSWTPAPIDGFAQVAGQWEGLMVRAPRSKEDDWVKLRIHEDGTYQFAAYRTVGVFGGKGQFTLKDGTLFVETERGTATIALFVAEARRMLRAEGETKDGLKYSGELFPKP